MEYAKSKRMSPASEELKRVSERHHVHMHINLLTTLFPRWHIINVVVTGRNEIFNIWVDSEGVWEDRILMTSIAAK